MSLSYKQTQLIKTKLEKELEKLKKESSRLKKFPERGSSIEDNAEELEEFGGNVGLRSKMATLIAEVELALKKIQAGTYGICENCKKEIDPNRLKAFPSAVFCLDCQAKKVRPWWKRFLISRKK